MASEIQARKGAPAASVAVGEHVTIGDSGAEYVVVNVDHEKGSVELLHLKPGRIQIDVPVSTVRRRGPKLAPRIGND